MLDSVGSTWAIRSAACAKGGRLVVIGGTGGPKVELDVRRVYLSWLSILGTTMGSRADFAALLQMVNEGRWSPVIDSVRPLSEASRRMSE